MQKFTYDMFDHIEQPTFILSNIYHHHIGEINNVDIDDVNVNINMSSADEMSFNVYKERNGEKCNVWDDLVSFKYVYVPEHNEYYKIDVSLEEDNATVKKLTLTSAAEHELGNRIIRSLEVNTESDIERDEYAPTIFYDPTNPEASLLNRILSIKTPGWSVDHVDGTLCKIQRTFSISNQSIYQALTDTIAKEIECLFTFDSVNRKISAYDLDNICLNPECGYRGNFTDECPRCQGKQIHYGYGKDTNIFISYNNFSDKMTVDGDEGQVKNCFYVTGGDDNINAAIINCNPTGTAYIYKFSEADYKDMPPELVEKLKQYSAYYDENIGTYQEVVGNWYDAINNYYYYKTSMMPRMNGIEWEPDTGYDVGDIVYVKTLPSWCYLECIESEDSHKSGSVEFDATSVYEGQIIEDGDVKWIVRKNIITLPSSRQIVEGGGVAWKANKTYVKDETVFTSTLPYNLSLKCKVAGTSGSTEPVIADPQIDQEVTDGTVTWKVVQNEGDGLRQYFGNSNNMVYFLNSLPSSKSSIDNEIVNIGSLQFNNIFRMEVVDSNYTTDPVPRRVQKSNLRWDGNKCYVEDDQGNKTYLKDQYIPYTKIKTTIDPRTGTTIDWYNYKYINKVGEYTGEIYEFYNPNERLKDTKSWTLKLVNGNKYAQGFIILNGYTYYFKSNNTMVISNNFHDSDGADYVCSHASAPSDRNSPADFGRFSSLTRMVPSVKNYDVSKKWTEVIKTVDVSTYTWTGNVKVYNTGDKDDEYTTTVPLVAYLYTTQTYQDYMRYMQEKVEKRLNKSESTVKNLFNIPIPRDDNGNYDKEAETTFINALTQYSLDILKDCSKAYDSTLEVMQSQGTGDKTKTFYGYDLYNPLYYPYYHRKELVDAEMKIREATVKEWETKRDNYYKSMREWQDKFDLTKFVGEELYTIFWHYIREGDYNNPNYISDGISDGEVINYAKKVLELANEELTKATKLQLTLSDSLQNLLNTTEFRDYKDDFRIGDWIVCEADDEPYRLRLIGVSYNYGNPESITVTFSNVTKVQNYLSDAQDILSKAQSMTTSYNATVHQVEKSSAVTDEVATWEDTGISSEETKIVSNDVEEIMYDDNGIIAREYDDVTQTFSPEQLRIQNNKIMFTKDNWETTALAIGKNEFNYYNENGELVKGEDYGVNAKFVDAGYITGGQIIGSDIYSPNYIPGADGDGSYINMLDGSFSFAGGGFTGKKNQDGTYTLRYKGEVEASVDVGIGSAIGAWTVVESGLQDGSSLITPTIVKTSGSVISDKVYANTDIYINNQSLTSTLSGKQNTLTAGDNITIENDVISATSGTTVIPNPSDTATDTLNKVQIDNTVYSISGGGGSDVEVNPSGSATATMKKLRVDNTIYGLPYKELTQAEYDALPDTKLSDDVVYFIKPYTDHSIMDNKLVVREFNDGTIIWYFNDYTWVDDGEGDIIIPAELVPFLPENPLGGTNLYIAVTSSYYSDPSHPEYGERDGWIGFRYNYPTQGDVYVMSYTLSWYSNNSRDNARLIVGNGTPEGDYGETQVTEYVAPDEDEYIPRDAKAKIILNGNEYIGGGGGSKSEIVELLQADYDALSSDKKNNGDLYMVYDEPQLDPDYNYYKWGDNDEIVVRVYHEGENDEEIRWYFHNYSQQATLLPIPSELSNYWSGTNSAKAYTPNTTTVYGWMAISDSQGGVRGIYSTSWSTYLTGAIDAVIVMGDGAEQDTTYSDPYVYINQNPISRKIYLHEREYTHKVTANPSGTPETNLNQLEVDGTIYSIPSGGGGGGGASYYLHNGLVGASGGSYVTCNLDNMMEAGTYLVTIRDASTNGGLITSYFIEWRNSTINLPVSIGTLTITDSTAGLSYYSGAYRDIYCNIIRII